MTFFRHEMTYALCPSFFLLFISTLVWCAKTSRLLNEYHTPPAPPALLGFASIAPRLAIIALHSGNSEPEARTGGNPNGLSASSVQRYFTVLKSIMAQAYKLGLTTINPTDTDRLTLPKIEETEAEIFTKDETAQMLTCLENESIPWQTLINLAIVTGARRGELVGLQWSDINFKENAVEIKRSNYKLKGETIQSKNPKSKKSIRTITIDGYTVGLLNTWRTEQIKTRLSLGDAWHDGDWVFTQCNGKPMYPTTPSLWFNDFQQRHGIPTISFTPCGTPQGRFY